MFQKLSYPKKSERAHMNIDDTMIAASSRQAVGSLLGGGNISSSWGTYIIPASIARRPIPGGAIVTGALCVVAALWGYPMDLAIWPPVLCVALIVGVFLPLMEAGMQMTREGKTTQSAALVVISSVLVNPVFGWSFTMLLDNLGLVGCKDRAGELGKAGRWLIPGITFLVLCTVMALIGMFPGVPAIMETFRM